MVEGNIYLEKRINVSNKTKKNDSFEENVRAKALRNFLLKKDKDLISELKQEIYSYNRLGKFDKVNYDLLSCLKAIIDEYDGVNVYD